MYNKKNKFEYKRVLAILLTFIMVITTLPIPVYAEEKNVADKNEGFENFVTNNTYTGIEKENVSLEEDILLRDKFTKHYIDPNGNRYAVVFPEQVHYSENDSWVEIDNTLSWDETAKRYVSKNKKFRTRFSQVSDDSQLVTIEDGSYKLSWSISFASAMSEEKEQNSLTLSKDTTVQKIAKVSALVSEINDAAISKVKSKETIQEIGKAISGIRYNGVFADNVDLRYSVLHGKVEEDVIINSPEGFTSYTLTVDTHGLTAIKRDDNSIAFVTSEGETIFALGAPWMKDSYISFSDDIEVTVQQKGDEARITYTPNAEWLNDQSRVYPVLIDPSFTTRFYTSNYEDTYVHTGDNASNTRHTSTTLVVGSSNAKQYYAYIKILNIPDLVGGFGANNMTLHFWTTTISSSALSIYEVNDQWDPQTITYANQPTATLIKSNQVGATSESVTKYSIDLTDWLDDISYEYYNISDYFSSDDWNGFKIGHTTNTPGVFTHICSSEYSTATYRPVITIQYDYWPYGGIENDAVYSFVNYASNKYLTVDSSNTSSGNVYQYTKDNSRSQAFRLDYNTTNDCYRIRTMCSNDGYGSVLEVPSYSGTINDSTGYIDSNVRIYSYSESWANDQDWIVYTYDDSDLYMIVLRADPNLALTAYGTSNGSTSGVTSTSAGNVYVSQFTGASNQLWKMESGGVQVLNATNIKDVDEVGETYSVYENSTMFPFCCPVTEFGATVTWSSSNSQSVDVDEVGHITIGTAGMATIYADVDFEDGSVYSYSCIIYVRLEDGTYYFNDVANSRRLEYEVPTDLSENAVLESFGSDTTEPTARYRIFKVKYLGEGLYSIRSMLDCTMGWTRSSTNLVMTTIGTTDSAVPATAKWRIKSNANGYYIHSAYGTSRTVTAGTSGGENIKLNSYSSTNTLQNWTIKKITQSYHGVTLTSTTDTLVLGDTYDFDAVMYSTYTNVNGGDGFTWSVANDTGSASINSTTGKLTGKTAGTVTVKVKYEPNSYQEWVAECDVYIIPISEGQYLLNNAKFDKFMQVDNNSSPSSSGAIFELWDFDGNNDQRWNFDYISNGYYRITSVASGLAATAPSSTNDSITQTSYTGGNNQLWKITSAGSSMYKLSPKSNSSYYMAAGDGTFTSDGRNVEMRASQSDNKDEWILISSQDISLIALPEEYDRTSFFDSVISEMSTIGYVDYYENKDFVDRGTDQGELICRMANTKITVIRTHGSKTSITTSDGSLTRSEVNNMSSSILNSSELIIYGACLTGSGREGASNLVNATYDRGCAIVIGFEKSVWNTEVNEWCDVFFQTLSDGKTVLEACNAADKYIAEEWYNEEEPEYDIRTDSWYIAGDSSTTFS